MRKSLFLVMILVALAGCDTLTGCDRSENSGPRASDAELQTGCPQTPNRQVALALPPEMAPQEMEALGAAMYDGLAASEAINVAIRFLDGARGEEFPACGGFINDARLRSDAGLRIEVAVAPLIAAFHSRYQGQRVTVPADMVGVAEHLARFANSQIPTAAVIYAPLQRNRENDVQVAIRDDRFPSLGHLTASPRDSTLSVVGHEDRLRGVEMYLVSPSTEVWGGAVGQLWRGATTNFWVCWLQAQGATVYVGSSLETAVQMAIDAEGAPAQCVADPTQNKPEMLTVIPPQRAEICDVQLASTSVGRTERTSGRVEIGIVWEGGATVDLDLHARAEPTAPELYFQHTVVPGGTLNKRAARVGETGWRGFEWVTFDDVRIQDVRLAVNLYEVRGVQALARGPRGQLRVAFDGRCYVRDFSIRARSGNRGEGRDDPNRAARPEWVELDLADLVLSS